MLPMIRSYPLSLLVGDLVGGQVGVVAHAAPVDEERPSRGEPGRSLPP